MRGWILYKRDPEPHRELDYTIKNKDFELTSASRTLNAIEDDKIGLYATFCPDSLGSPQQLTLTRLIHSPCWRRAASQRKSATTDNPFSLTPPQGQKKTVSNKTAASSPWSPTSRPALADERSPQKGPGLNLSRTCSSFPPAAAAAMSIRRRLHQRHQEHLAARQASRLPARRVTRHGICSASCPIRPLFGSSARSRSSSPRPPRPTTTGLHAEDLSSMARDFIAATPVSVGRWHTAATAPRSKTEAARERWEERQELSAKGKKSGDAQGRRPQRDHRRHLHRRPAEREPLLSRS